MNDDLTSSSGTGTIKDRQRLPPGSRLLRGMRAFAAVTLATAVLGNTVGGAAGSAVGGAAGGVPELLLGGGGGVRELLLGAAGGLLAQLSSRAVESLVEAGAARGQDWTAVGRRSPI